MIQRIISIKNIGRFKNCAAAGDVTFRQYTLIFAENARGKTTLCDILRSLSKADPAIVIGRTTLGSADRPEVQLLTANGPVSFRNGAWTGIRPDLAIFDSAYVRENVYAGDSVDTEHRRNLYRVIVGAQGVAHANQVVQLDEQIRDKNAEIRENRASIQGYVPRGIAIEAFFGFELDPDIDGKIAAKEQELDAARQAVQLQQRPGLTMLEPPVFPVEFSQVLARTFAYLSADAERRVQEHVIRHAMQVHGETWITEGLNYLREGACPFCNQPVEAVDLIRDYNTYFSRQYRELRDDVDRLRGQVDISIGERRAAGLAQVILQNQSRVEYWQRYTELPIPGPTAALDPGRALGRLHQSAQRLLQIKASHPLDAVPSDPEFTGDLAAFEEFRAALASYNAATATANEAIAAKKTQLQTADVGQTEVELIGLRTRKIRFAPEVVALCDRDTQLQDQKTVLEDEKATARGLLDAHTQQVIAQYGQRINWYLERINASFRITAPTHNYRGGSPSTSYQIVINHNAVDLGDPDTAPDQPSFKNTLSGGDRSTLALAFFFAQLEQDPNRANKNVIFDDPFASMDSFRRSHTVHQIFRCGQESAQVVVLSHDPNFLHLLWERVQPADRKTLMFARIGEENTTVVEWDIEQAVRARYRADLEVLQGFYCDGQGERRDIIQKLRPVLEAYCRNLYPLQFNDEEMMGGIIMLIRNGGVTHPLAPIADDLDEINVYCRRYHHGENLNAATEQVDDNELRGYVGRTLRLVGCLT